MKTALIQMDIVLGDVGANRNKAMSMMEQGLSCSSFQRCGRRATNSIRSMYSVNQKTAPPFRCSDLLPGSIR